MRVELRYEGQPDYFDPKDHEKEIGSIKLINQKTNEEFTIITKDRGLTIRTAQGILMIEPLSANAIEIHVEPISK